MKHFRLPLFFGAACLALAQSPTINDLPSRVFGHPKLSNPVTTASPNLVEGREFNQPQSIAIDASSTPPILYVADTFNNRVLAWKDITAITKGNFADKAIGQRDLVSTVLAGPGTDFSTGMIRPVAVAVDRSGNLYVVDSGNNRILRYPKPFAQTSEPLVVDLVIGQKSVNAGNQSNQGLQAPSERTVFTNVSGATSGVAFDAAGNLWFSDAGNHRALRYPVSQLAPNTSEPTADVVLGQQDFSSRALPQGNNNVVTNRNSLVLPSGLAFDQAGRLYVCDGLAQAAPAPNGGRVLQFAPPFSPGKAASRILGLSTVPAQGQPAPSVPNSVSLGTVNSQNQPLPPEGVVTFGNDVFVIDTPNHRIVHYDPPEMWPAETSNQPSPPMRTLTGQPDFSSNKINRDRKEPNEFSLSGPVAAGFNGADLWVADTFNHRVLMFPHQGGFVYSSATRALGQLDFTFNAPNLIEGREVFFGDRGVALGAAMAFDKSSDPPHLYISDPLNHRVLGFRDGRVVRPGDRADLVIGQPDFLRALVNYPSGDPLLVNDTGLNGPVGLAVDAAGNLLVADTGNGRVLRFPSPFNQPPGALPRANLVLGQDKVTSQSDGVARQTTMRTPWGLALFFGGHLAVSDATHHRVLFFRRPEGGDFSSGQAAASVFGQPNFISSQTGSTEDRMNAPRHIASDIDDRLYLCDSSNNRLLIFTRVPTAANGATPASAQTGLNNPQGVAVIGATQEIWVTNSSANQILRLPDFLTLILNPGRVTASLAALTPMAVAVDAFDNLLVAEASNRISFYFAKLAFQNAANYNSRALAPGMLAYLYRQGAAFKNKAAPIQPTPWPTELSDLQVTVNGAPAAIFQVVESRVDIQVPMSAPSSGTAEIQVVRKSTGEILAVSAVQMDVAAPGFFAANAQGFGQIAATNADDNSVNSPTNGVGRGKFITFYLTGQGFVPNAPPDGMPPTAATPTPVRPVVIINGVPVPDADIQYSGLGAFPGGWQINVKVSESVPPGNNIIVAVLLRDVASNIGPNNQRVVTTISVK